MAPTHGVLPPHKADNEVVRLDLDGSGFLCLLRELLRKQFPDHPLWKDSLFSCGEYLRFATRVESSLVRAFAMTKDALRKEKRRQRLNIERD
jgi:hypothetical protein